MLFLIIINRTMISTKNGRWLTLSNFSILLPFLSLLLLLLGKSKGKLRAVGVVSPPGLNNQHLIVPWPA